MLAKIKEIMERLATLHTTPISTSRSQAVSWVHCVDQNSRQPFRWNLDAEVRFKGNTEWNGVLDMQSTQSFEFDHPLTFTFVSTRHNIHLAKQIEQNLASGDHFLFPGRPNVLMCDGDRKIWWFMVYYHGQPASSKFSSMEPKIFVQNPSSIPRRSVRQSSIFITDKKWTIVLPWSFLFLNFVSEM